MENTAREKCNEYLLREYNWTLDDFEKMFDVNIEDYIKEPYEINMDCLWIDTVYSQKKRRRYH